MPGRFFLGHSVPEEKRKEENLKRSISTACTGPAPRGQGRHPPIEMPSKRRLPVVQAASARRGWQTSHSLLWGSTITVGTGAKYSRFPGRRGHADYGSQPAAPLGGAELENGRSIAPEMDFSYGTGNEKPDQGNSEAASAGKGKAALWSAKRLL